jgi:hypothetical protein
MRVLTSPASGHVYTWGLGSHGALGYDPTRDVACPADKARFGCNSATPVRVPACVS